ncbi:uncharacterized protein RJT21DRAFT_118922 [Scheffersomyces amazonensis]|uniref:uncharacterized protein n=1 Tax=Scheffersomyces amazonensis TaxID=1078765 RepID=UPI00315C64C0
MSRRSGRSRYSEQPPEYADNYEAEGEDDEDEEDEVIPKGQPVRSGSGSGSGKGKIGEGTETEPIDGDLEVEAEEEDEIDEEDEQEITRCICGQDELTSVDESISELLNKEYNINKIDQGLFIQCDKCSVWQHGYCVGLFINEDVPDKYWCELCKPDLHIFIYDNSGELIRTLYKPTNEKRKKLLAMDIHKPFTNINSSTNNSGNNSGNNSSNNTNSTNSTTNNNNNNNRSKSKRTNPNIIEKSPSQPSKTLRKERRHYEDTYDEQLQKALRESAKESGIPLGSKRGNSDNGSNSTLLSTSTSTSKRRLAKSDDSDESRHNNHNNISKSEIESDQDPSNIEDDTESASNLNNNKSFKRTKSRGRGVKSKKTKTSTPTPKSNNENGGISALTKEELINQPSKPRYVSDKSSVYELRKRTGAILEWLGRSQIELEEDKLNKIELFSYKEEIEVNGTTEKTSINVHEEENNKLIGTFNENLSLMERLTEKILNWEQQFGKYAP